MHSQLYSAGADQRMYYTATVENYKGQILKFIILILSFEIDFLKMYPDQKQI